MKKHIFKPQKWMKIVGIWDKKFIRAMAKADEFAAQTAYLAKQKSE